MKDGVGMTGASIRNGGFGAGFWGTARNDAVRSSGDPGRRLLGRAPSSTGSESALTVKFGPD